MNMGFWIPEANFYRQSSFLVSCQIKHKLAHSSAQDTAKQNVAKHRTWGWGKDNISEGLSEVYITYIFYCCLLSWDHALPTDMCAHISFQSARVASSHLSEYIGVWGHTGAHQMTEPEAEQGELKTRKPVLSWERKEVNGQPQICLTSRSILFEQPGQSFCFERLLQCKCFHQGNLYWTVRETMNKITRSMSAEEIWRSWPYNHSVLVFEKESNPASEVLWFHN